MAINPHDAAGCTAITAKGVPVCGGLAAAAVLAAQQRAVQQQDHAMLASPLLHELALCSQS
eukprot:20663-Heterococcus_DN1.PRE.5